MDRPSIDFKKTNKEIQAFVKTELALDCEVVTKWGKEYVQINGLPKDMVILLRGERVYSNTKNHFVSFYATYKTSGRDSPCCSWDDLTYFIEDWLNQAGVKLNRQLSLF